MDLDRSLLKDFSELVNTTPEERFKNENVRGTVKMVGDKKYVKLDGSEALTPITETVDAQEGDRVLVSIENHRATILGNYTYSPSARKEQEALDSAGEAKEESSLASQKAQSAMENANKANENASIASSQANEAKELAEDAKTAADAVVEDVTEAKEQAGVALSKAEEAQNKALESFEATNAAKQEIDSLNREVTDVKEDITGALTDLGELAKETQTIKETMEVEYTKKTELSEVEASLKTEISKSVSELQTTMSETYFAKSEAVELEGKLQSQITQNAEGLGSVVSKTEKLESDTAAAQQAVNEAKKTAAEAQANADKALTNASAAQTAADSAKENADLASQKATAAQTAANAAKATAEKADKDLAAARTDLDEAKKNLSNVTNRVDATEEEIAAAQQAVNEAQQNVEKALEDVADAQYAAGQAQNAANKAQQDATNAKTAADNAQTKADNAKEVADKAQADATKAQKDVAALTKRVTTAETNISQNAEKIELTAKKTEEIGDDLKNNYYTKTQADAAIKVESNGIKQTVSKVEETAKKAEQNALDAKDSIDNLEVGGRNYFSNKKEVAFVTSNEYELDSRDTYSSTYFKNYTVSPVNFVEKEMLLTFEAIGPSENVSMLISTPNYTIARYVLIDPETTLRQVGGVCNSFWTKNVIPFTYEEQSSITEPEPYEESKTVCFWANAVGVKIRNVKIEIGTKPTDYTEAPEDIRSSINQSINNATEIIKEEYKSLIDQTAENIDLMIESLKTITDGNTTSITSLKNQLEITSETAQFVKTTVETLENVVNGKLSESEIKEWARFDGANLELGASNSPFKAKLSNTELAFWQGNNKVAWISNNELNILTAIIAKSIGCGNFTFIDEGDLGFSLL